MIDTTGFKDARNKAELMLSPAKPLGRSVANFSGLKLGLGSKLPLPGIISSVSDVTGSLRGAFNTAMSIKTATQQLSSSLTSVLAQFDVLHNQSLNGQFIPTAIATASTVAGLPAAADFLNFSSLVPGSPIPASFGSLVTERKTQLQALSARMSTAFNNAKSTGVSIQENFNKQPYPLADEIDIPSVPRLAQGGEAAAADAILKDKRKFVVAGVPVAAGKPRFWSRLISTASAMLAPPTMNAVVNQLFTDRNNSGSWSEPTTPYAAQFPYNKVQQTESGHVIELDDTPGAERVHFFHRSGSFIEFHPNGTVVYKNMKDGYNLTMGDHHVKVSGKCHVAVDGGATLYVKGNVDIQSDGDVNVNAKKDFNVYAQNVNLRAKSTFKADGTGIDLRFLKFGLPGINALSAVSSLASSAGGKLVSNPLSNPAAYVKKGAEAAAYRARMFDTPEETENFELYGAHIGLQKTLGDIPTTTTTRTLGGKLTAPAVTVSAPASKPTINYLNYDNYKGTFAYANNYTLGGTSFRLQDVVDIAINKSVVSAVPTAVAVSSVTGDTGFGSGVGYPGPDGAVVEDHSLGAIPNYSAFVRQRWDELNNMPQHEPYHENGAKFLRIIAHDIHNGLNGATKDSRCGLWQKRSASTINDRDPDKLVFLMSDTVVGFVDIIVGHGSASASPGWDAHYDYGTKAACDDATRCQGWVVPQGPEPL